MIETTTKVKLLLVTHIQQKFVDTR